MSDIVLGFRIWAKAMAYCLFRPLLFLLLFLSVQISLTGAKVGGVVCVFSGPTNLGEEKR